VAYRCNMSVITLDAFHSIIASIPSVLLPLLITVTQSLNDCQSAARISPLIDETRLPVVAQSITAALQAPKAQAYYLQIAECECQLFLKTSTFRPIPRQLGIHLSSTGFAKWHQVRHYCFVFHLDALTKFLAAFGCGTHIYSERCAADFVLFSIA